MNETERTDCLFMYTKWQIIIGLLNHIPKVFYVSLNTQLTKYIQVYTFRLKSHDESTALLQG